MSGIQLLFRINSLLFLLAGLIGCRQSDETADRQQALVSEPVPYYNTPDFTPVWLTNPIDIQQKITHRIADFAFYDQTNRLFTQDSIANKIYVANFFFTACPSICPKMTNLLKAVQDTFLHEPKVALVSFSVTPWLDSIPRLRQYAANKGIISTKWHLLTGERGKLYELARRSYFAEEAIGFSKDSTEFLHTEHLILVDQNRRIRGFYNGTLPLDVDKLIADMNTLLRE
ncbi:SCO family protein [Spirosoma aureum]|uniref:SCO family protein n=1 Tax=Spirosoma aureum TaxID=2692134 RepID=A0A6G9AJB5_9BACT|nr:SCO family protein [Spirosoma aureum]QIP12365.1 SCO family protein [Spirosoma aureum]